MLDTRSLEFGDEFEKLFLPANELGARLSRTAIGFGHVPQRVDVLGRGREVLRTSLSPIGEDGAGMELTAIATTGRFAALAAQGVERSWQEGITSEEFFQQARQELLSLQELGTEGTEPLVHEESRGKRSGPSVDQYK